MAEVQRQLLLYLHLVGVEHHQVWTKWRGKWFTLEHPAGNGGNGGICINNSVTAVTYAGTGGD